MHSHLSRNPLGPAAVCFQEPFFPLTFILWRLCPLVWTQDLPCSFSLSSAIPPSPSSFLYVTRFIFPESRPGDLDFTGTRGIQRQVHDFLAHRLVADHGFHKGRQQVWFTQLSWVQHWTYIKLVNEWTNKWGKKTNKIQVLYQENWNCWLLQIRGTTTASFGPYLNQFKTELYSLVFPCLFPRHSSHLLLHAVLEHSLKYVFMLASWPRESRFIIVGILTGAPSWVSDSSSTSLQANFQSLPIKPHPK